jgi:4-amino-4-deoxy-L-arabinose transferase-like glycosyltransferase
MEIPGKMEDSSLELALLLKQARLKRNRAPAGKAFSGNAKSRNPTGETGATRIAQRLAVKHALLLAAVIGFTWLAYANSFRAPMLLDNDAIVLRDPRVHAVTPVQLHRILTQQYWETANTGLYRPLTTLSFLFNYAVLGNGPDPYGYHWINFILHAVNIVLVYALGLAIFERIPAALAVSALWGLHPVLTESVTNIVGRSDMLAAFCVLAALLCHRKALDATGVRKVAWLAAIGLAAAAGIFSKESAIVVVAVFAIYDFTFGRAASWLSRIPSYAAAVIPCLVYLYVRSQVLASASYQVTPFFENPLLGAGFWTARITAAKVIGKYLGLLVWPARLSWDYGYNEIPVFGWGLGNWEDWKAIAALFGCAAAAVVAIRSWRSRKVVFFAVAFFFATLSPTSNFLILIGTIMGERFLYLPSVGFAVAVVWAFDALWRRVPAGQPAYRYVAGAGLCVLLVGFAARTYDRNRDWLDPRRFWLSAAAAAPGSYKANMSAAANTFPVTQEDVVRSIRHADHALAIVDGLPDSQNSPTAYYDAAIFCRNLGDRLTSKDAAAKASAGSDARYWYRRSLSLLLRSERIELAWDGRYRAENARRGKPGLTSLPSKLYLGLGRAYLRLSDTPHALAAFERGRALESAPELLEELASLYRAAGDPRKAAMALVEALAVDPKRTELYSPLVELYGQIDPQGCAVTRQNGTLGLNPDCPLVHGDICAASRNVIGNYLRRGQQFEAAYSRRIAEQDLACAPGLLN